MKCRSFLLIYLAALYVQHQFLGNLHGGPYQLTLIHFLFPLLELIFILSFPLEICFEYVL